MNIVSAQVIEPYAQALMSVAQSHSLVDPFGNTLRSLLSLLNESADFRSFLENPLVRAEDKKAVLRQVLGDANQYFVNFLMLLVDRRRIVFVEAIAQKYLELQRQLNNTVLAEVSTATKLTDEQREAISNKVKELTGAQGVELRTSVDPDLIGGAVIKVGSQVYDASLRGQLRRIRVSLGKVA
ncbi:MAG: ATP synthase F1 subunit delta [Cyanophyceae cyanobacterium]